ncbi:hypothetical protein [Paenibacillus sp. IHBB 10380]|uniref:hypothetical protein n=1 Tax=Paenibacillus sp. IHBB 10380 TaxID=1566358 RepID=UPI0005CF9B7A|nr:hypothetical protein [Paenibacillus sp. IHBB 10380]AJS58810.1 hypothetical protein UB51_10365 [Paenibacillus sp. IHBB 10380]
MRYQSRIMMIIFGLLLVVPLISCNLIGEKKLSSVEIISESNKIIQDEIKVETKDETDIPEENSKSELRDLLVKSNGSWIDDSYNLYQNNESENSIDIGSKAEDGLSGSICFFLYNPDRVTDSCADFTINNDKSAEFTFDDEYGKGKGLLLFAGDEIRMRLTLETANDEIKEAYIGERIFIRNPYKGLKHYDPITVIQDKTGDLSNYTLEISDSVEWGEGLKRSILEVVNLKNEEGNIEKLYIVNTLNKFLKEIIVE